jgi:nucleotide-binding universal stress UspA family protein
MIKTILVPARGNEADALALAAALDVARPFAAHIDALHIRPDPVAMAVAMTTDAVGGTMSTGVIDRLEQDASEGEAAAHDIFTKFCRRRRLAIIEAPAKSARPSAQWHVETGDERRWLTAYGVAADLIVASRAAAADPDPRPTLETALLETGRPLLIPSAAAPSAAIADRIAIAWKPTPQASRAVAAAMPFLARAKEIVVMTVEEKEEGGDEGMARLVRNLAWHGFKASAQRLTPDRRGAAEILFAAATQQKVGLLVMGGFGHSQLREWVFGGFTQQVLESAPIPVLICH